MSQCYLRYRKKGSEAVDLAVDTLPCRIGRSSSSDLVIADISISCVHAMLSLDDRGVLVLEDLGSTNGIYLNYRKVSRVEITGFTHVIMGTVSVDLALSPADLPPPLPPVTPAAAGNVPWVTENLPPPLPPVAPSAAGNVPWVTENLPPPLPSVAFSDTPYPPDSSQLRRLQMPSLAPEGSPAATLTKLSANRAGGIICPHCWYQFDVDEFLFIARHQSLTGDPVLGADAAQRFLPSLFTPEGNAYDAAGMSCPDMACPRCHLRIPQAASEMPPLFLSIVGATASGKSYFLTSMTWTLRNVLPQDFSISFTDTDAVNNRILNDFEETIFLHGDANELVALRKTELQGELYNQVLLDNMLINLPKPFMFSLMPAEHHPRYQEVRSGMSRTLVLYDNAGEHFEPGMDSVDNPTTQHLLHSDTIFFLFDPTKDVRFRRRLTGVDDPQLDPHARVQRQEIILTEMINRIKKYSGMRASGKTAKTMLLLVSKFDVWRHLLDEDLPPRPWQWEDSLKTCALDVPLLKNVSFQVRHLLESICPEVVSTAESFAGDVLYLPNSALGHSPEINEATGMIGIRPADVSPWWVTVPMLFFFWERGFIPSIPPDHQVRHSCADVRCSRSGDIFFVQLPGQNKPLMVPLSYAGYELRCPGTDLWFSLPAES